MDSEEVIIFLGDEASVLLFVLQWGEVAESGVATSSVVEDFDVLENGGFQF